MLKVILFLQIFLISSWSLVLPWGHTKGSSSFSLLNQNISTRTLFGGGAGLPIGTVFSAIETNPAQIDSALNHTSFYNQSLPQEFQANISGIGFSKKFNTYEIGFGLKFLNFESIDGFDEQGNPTHPYGAFEFDLETKLSAILYSKLQMGVGLGYSFQNIEALNLYTFIGHIGMVYQLHSNFSIGIAWRNIEIISHTNSTQNNKKVFPASVLQTGIAYQHQWNIQWLSTILLDAKINSDTPLHFPIQIETQFIDWMGVRVHYNYQDPHHFAGLGFYFNYNKLRLDYDISSQFELNPNHTLALGISI